MTLLTRAWLASSLLGLSILAGVSPANAQTVPFKIYITELWQLDTGVDPGIGLLGDYYAKVTINGVTQDNEGACDDQSITGILVPFQFFKNFSKISECGDRTPWAFSANVPAGQPVHVKIQVFDDDLVFDDEADLKVGDGSAIDLVIDPVTGQWSGDVDWPQTCSRPGLSLGGQNVNVCWQASTDTDSDGLLDVWERSGVDTDNDGVIDVDLAALGANPLRKDAFVELDHLQAADHTHRPFQLALDHGVRAFANAPLGNPDGTTGIQLHIDVGPAFGAGTVVTVAGTGGVSGTFGDLGGGNAIAEAGNEIIRSFEKTTGGTPFADLKAANFNSLRETLFRYVIFGHQTNARRATNDCTSGEASVTRRDFMVTLGGLRAIGLTPCRDTDAGGHSVGGVFQQAGTLMHELGHVLGLRHGGDVDVNRKPNYLSVMSYAFQSCGVPSVAGLLPGQCDYSRLVSGALLPDLVETDLDECVGIGGGLGLGQMDFNANGLFEGVTQCGPIAANVSADTNNDGVCITAGADRQIGTVPAGDDEIQDGVITDGPNRVCNTEVATGTDDVQKTALGDAPTQPDTLESFDDWANVTPGLIGFTSGFGAGVSDSEPEADPDALEAARLHMNKMTAPGITIDQTGPATAKPGDLLTYRVKVTNTGSGPALSAVLRHFAPDGTGHPSDAGIIPVGGEVTDNVDFTVPANACPGSLTGAAASLTFKNFVSDALTASDVTPLQILDVAPPSIEVSLSPNVLWPPNHKFVTVTATITASDNCDPSPAVRLVSITSNEPESGAIGGGDRAPDIQGATFGTDDRTFELRAERDTGQGRTGRIYTVTYRVTDSSGNATDGSATVLVPANNGRQ